MQHRFKDRREAGRLLAEKLAVYKGNTAIVLALVRGGVPVGYEIAQRLALPLDIVVVRKIGHPGAPEYALGAVDEEGNMYIEEPERSAVDPDWLGSEIEKEQVEAKRRARVYRAGRSPLRLQGKTVILTDDGIATGATMQLAVRRVQSADPERVVVGVPVASRAAIDTLRREVDEVVVLVPPEEFLGAVGAHYQHFDQVGDEEVIHFLSSAG